mmetsp:Transcript_18670/g.41660  ORF Transcript_18670/g.41660 Transcript_18670/m.41660 type:complete len:286 (-) Transcript_18670:12-869(-)
MQGWFGSGTTDKKQHADEDRGTMTKVGATNPRDSGGRSVDPFLADARSAGSSSVPRQLTESHREPVNLKVYDLGKSFMTRGVLNAVTKSYGAFHSGVEVYGREWSFGMTMEDWATGVTWNPPGLNADHSFKESIVMGYTTLSPESVWKIIQELKREWLGCTYHILQRNCHHFSDELLRRLGVRRAPPWLNDLAESGAATAEFLDSADSGYDGGEALYDFFDSVKKTVFYALGGNPESDAPRQKRTDLPARAEVVPTSMTVVPATERPPQGRQTREAFSPEEYKGR